MNLTNEWYFMMKTCICFMKIRRKIINFLKLKLSIINPSYNCLIAAIIWIRLSLLKRPENLFSTLNLFPERNLFPNLWKCFSIRDSFAPSMDPSYPSFRKSEGWKFKKISIHQDSNPWPKYYMSWRSNPAF